MDLKKNNLTRSLIKWWSVSSLPDQHIYLFSIKKRSISTLFRSIFIHPVKRRVAKYYVFLLQKVFGLKVVGITGSAGKTTTKEMIASILSQKFRTQWSYANIDPIYNIPTTILKTHPFTKYLVLEMGIEYKGEMDFYIWLVKPQIGVITNIAPTHILFLKNEKGVFKEKSKLVTGLKKSNTAVLNFDNKYLKTLTGLPAKTVWVNREISADNIQLSLEGTRFGLKIDNRRPIDIFIPAVGPQFVQNALFASAVGLDLGCSLEEIKQGLLAFEPGAHRMKVMKHKSGAVILDDSYNNNPHAAKEAIHTLSGLKWGSKKIIVFGDMLELGKEEEKYHIDIANEIKKSGIDGLICIGPLSKKIGDTLRSVLKDNVECVNAVEQAYPLLKRYLAPDTIILIKGSRSMKLDLLVSQLFHNIQ